MPSIAGGRMLAALEGGAGAGFFSPSNRSGLDWVDWGVVGLYATSVLVLGYGCSRKQESTDGYYTGGGNMSPFLIGISLFASLLSTVSYLAYPGEIMQHGPIYLFGILSIPIAYLLVGYIMVPRYMAQRVTSAYELLEERLGLAARLSGAILFILLRLVWMALLVYLASEAMLVMTGLDHAWLPVFSLGTGMVAILYTSLGGLRAVVITDCLQFFLLLAGAVIVVVQISLKLGGLDWIPTEWNSNWDVQPVYSLDPRVRATLVGTLVMQTVFRVATAGGDQTVVQRFMATMDATAARRAYLVQSLAGAVVTLFLGLLGFALLGFFEANPGLSPYSIETQADFLFPYYIAHQLPSGVAGMVVAALFAAGMSSIDSGVNSITAVVNRDFLIRLGNRQFSGRSVRFNQLLALGIGLVTVLASILAQYVPGNYLEVTQKTSNLLFPALFGLFIYAIFIPRATGAVALVGTLNGVVTAIVVGFWDVLTGEPAISFQWIGFSSLLANLVPGLLLIFLRDRYTVIPEHRWTGLFLVTLVLLWTALFNLLK